jgi:bacterioferritin (cytochrome b1)
VTPDPKVIAALNDCLAYERTLQDCHDLYWHYFRRAGFHRLADDHHGFTRWARKRKQCLETRIFRLDSVPGDSRYEVEFKAIAEPDDIAKVMRYFEGTYEGARKIYNKARDAAKDAGDSTTAGLCKAHKAALECELVRTEAKLKRIELVGPAIYLAHHMHMEN